MMHADVPKKSCRSGETFVRVDYSVDWLVEYSGAVAAEGAFLLCSMSKEGRRRQAGQGSFFQYSQ